MILGDNETINGDVFSGIGGMTVLRIRGDLNVKTQTGRHPTPMKSPLRGSEFYDTAVTSLDFDRGCKHISTTYGNDFL